MSEEVGIRKSSMGKAIFKVSLQGINKKLGRNLSFTNFIICEILTHSVTYIATEGKTVLVNIRVPLGNSLKL